MSDFPVTCAFCGIAPRSAHLPMDCIESLRSQLAAKDAEIGRLTRERNAYKERLCCDEAPECVHALHAYEYGIEKARAEKAEREVDILKGVRNTWRAEVAAQKERYDVMAGKALAAKARAEKAERERDEARDMVTKLVDRELTEKARADRLAAALRNAPHQDSCRENTNFSYKGCDCWKSRIAAAALEEK